MPITGPGETYITGSGPGYAPSSSPDSSSPGMATAAPSPAAPSPGVRIYGSGGQLISSTAPTPPDVVKPPTPTSRPEGYYNAETSAEYQAQRAQAEAANNYSLSGKTVQIGGVSYGIDRFGQAVELSSGQLRPVDLGKISADVASYGSALAKYENPFTRFQSEAPPLRAPDVTAVGTFGPTGAKVAFISPNTPTRVQGDIGTAALQNPDRYIHAETSTGGFITSQGFYDLQTGEFVTPYSAIHPELSKYAAGYNIGFQYGSTPQVVTTPEGRVTSIGDISDIKGVTTTPTTTPGQRSFFDLILPSARAETPTSIATTTPTTPSVTQQTGDLYGAFQAGAATRFTSAPDIIGVATRPGFLQSAFEQAPRNIAGLLGYEAGTLGRLISGPPPATKPGGGAWTLEDVNAGRVSVHDYSVTTGHAPVILDLPIEIQKAIGGTGGELAATAISFGPAIATGGLGLGAVKDIGELGVGSRGIIKSAQIEYGRGAFTGDNVYTLGKKMYTVSDLTESAPTPKYEAPITTTITPRTTPTYENLPNISYLTETPARAAGYTSISDLGRTSIQLPRSTIEGLPSLPSRGGVLPPTTTRGTPGIRELDVSQLYGISQQGGIIVPRTPYAGADIGGIFTRPIDTFYGYKTSDYPILQQLSNVQQRGWRYAFQMPEATGPARARPRIRTQTIQTTRPETIPTIDLSKAIPSDIRIIGEEGEYGRPDIIKQSTMKYPTIESYEYLSEQPSYAPRAPRSKTRIKNLYELDPEYTTPERLKEIIDTNINPLTGSTTIPSISQPQNIADITQHLDLVGGRLKIRTKDVLGQRSGDDTMYYLGQKTKNITKQRTDTISETIHDMGFIPATLPGIKTPSMQISPPKTRVTPTPKIIQPVPTPQITTPLPNIITPTPTKTTPPPKTPKPTPEETTPPFEYPPIDIGRIRIPKTPSIPTSGSTTQAGRRLRGRGYAFQTPLRTGLGETLPGLSLGKGAPRSKKISLRIPNILSPTKTRRRSRRKYQTK